MFDKTIFRGEAMKRIFQSRISELLPTFALTILLIAAMLSVPVKANPNELHVYPEGSIQDAINVANPGDIIIVHEVVSMEEEKKEDLEGRHHNCS